MRSSACYINTGIHTSLLHWRCILELKEKTTFCVLWSALIKRSKDVRPPNPNLKIRNMVTSTLPTSVLTTDISNGRKDARMDTIITNAAMVQFPLISPGSHKDFSDWTAVSPAPLLEQMVRRALRKPLKHKSFRSTGPRGQQDKPLGSAHLKSLKRTAAYWLLLPVFTEHCWFSGFWMKFPLDVTLNQHGGYGLLPFGSRRQVTSRCFFE